MKKKFLLFTMIIAVMCSILMGCGNNSNSDTTQTTIGTTAIDETQTSTTPVENESTVPDVDELTFYDYNSMSSEEQKAVVDSFENVDQFFEWYEEKKEEHKINPDGPIFSEVIDATAPEKNELTFLEYHNLSADEQKAFINSFISIDAFVEWHTAARKAYEDSLIGIDDTPIDAGELFGNEDGKGKN